MIHLFVGLIIVMCLANIYTFLGIIMQIMLVLDGFGKLRCGKILSKTYSTTQENNYLSLFIIYISSSYKASIYAGNHQIIVTIIVPLIPYH